jgi:cytochrome c biogenesis protein CcdA
MSVFKFQLGQFFLVIGVIMLAVFMVTTQGQSPLFSLLFGGVLLAMLGISLMTRNRTPLTEESARFRRVRRARQKSRERREKKRQKQQARRESAGQRQQEQRQQQSRGQQEQRQRQSRGQQEQRERQRQEQQEQRERQS